MEVLEHESTESQEGKAKPDNVGFLPSALLNWNKKRDWTLKKSVATNCAVSN